MNIWAFDDNFDCYYGNLLTICKPRKVVSGASASLWTYIQGQLGLCPHCGSWLVPWGDTRHLPLYNNIVCPLLCHNSLTSKGGFKM